jgi:hypothetical protein
MRHRDQYTDIDSLNKNNNDIESFEHGEDVDRNNKNATMGWSSLRAVGRFYCQLRKIKRQ